MQVCVLPPQCPPPCERLRLGRLRRPNCESATCTKLGGMGATWLTLNALIESRAELLDDLEGLKPLSVAEVPS